MIKDLDRRKSTKSKNNELGIDKTFRSQFFDDLEEIVGAYEIKEFKQTVKIKRSYQCLSTGKVVYVRVLF